MSHWWTDYSDYCNQYVASSYYGLGSSSAATQWWSRSDHCSVEKQRRVVVQWRSSTLPTALIGAWRAGLYQWKMRPTRSDHWTLNVLLPGGSDLISHWWIRGTRQVFVQDATGSVYNSTQFGFMIQLTCTPQSDWMIQWMSCYQVYLWPILSLSNRHGNWSFISVLMSTFNQALLQVLISRWFSGLRKQVIG